MGLVLGVVNDMKKDVNMVKGEMSNVVEDVRSLKEDQFVDLIKADTMSNVSFSGGDPFYQVEAFTELARRIKEETHKTIWCWTGFTLEEIRSSEHLSMMLPYLDVLVDGPYVKELRDTDLYFRGSSNQRVIYLTPREDDYIPGTVRLAEMR